MKYIDINKRYTEIVAEYIGKGYTINTSTMSGSQGETAKVDLTNGTEIIRVLVATFNDWNKNLEGMEIIVGKVTDEHIAPHRGDIMCTVWNDRLEVLSREQFFKIGENYRNGPYYGTEAEAKDAVNLRFARYISRNRDRKNVDITAKAIEIAKRVIRREFGVKRICERDITVSKCNGAYVIGYKNKSYRLR